MRTVVLFGLILVVGHASAQAGMSCSDKVVLQLIRLDDLVRSDTNYVQDVLRPDKTKLIRLKDLPGYEYTTPTNSSHQVLQLMDGFEGMVRIMVDDSLLFQGRALTNPSTSLSNIAVDLGVRKTGSVRRLRIEYGERCMTADLDGAYPIVMVYRLNNWVVNLTDHWPGAY